MYQKDVMKVALEALKKELEKEPVSPERVAAISEAIKAINGVSSVVQF